MTKSTRERYWDDFDYHPCAEMIPLYSEEEFEYPDDLDKLENPQLREQFMSTWKDAFKVINKRCRPETLDYQFPRVISRFLFMYAAPWSAPLQFELLMLIYSLPNIVQWLDDIKQHDTIYPLIQHLVTCGVKFPLFERSSDVVKLHPLWKHNDGWGCRQGIDGDRPHNLEPFIECHHRLLLGSTHLDDHPSGHEIRKYFATNPVCLYAIDLVKSSVPDACPKPKMNIYYKMLIRANPDIRIVSDIDPVMRNEPTSLMELLQKARATDDISTERLAYNLNWLSIRLADDTTIPRERQLASIEISLMAYEDPDDYPYLIPYVIVTTQPISKPPLLAMLTVLRLGFLKVSPAPEMKPSYNGWYEYQWAKEKQTKHLAALRFFSIMDRIPSDLYPVIVDAIYSLYWPLVGRTVRAVEEDWVQQVLEGKMQSTQEQLDEMKSKQDHLDEIEYERQYVLQLQQQPPDEVDLPELGAW